jgi:DNA-binding CsgD family transcriptional regulator
LGQTLDGLSVGIIILDARGRILETSTAARKVISNDTGINTDPDGRLRLRGAAHSNLYRWIDTGTPPQSNAEGLLQVPREDASALSVMVTPLPRTVDVWLSSSPRWLLLVVDPERQIRASSLLIEKDLGLTPREPQIAALLVAGYDLQTVAARSNISVSTARTHLKSIFSKTGLRSQVELVQRIRSGPAILDRR